VTPGLCCFLAVAESGVEMTKKDGYEDFQNLIFEQLDTLKASERQRTVKSKIICEHQRPMWEPCRKCGRTRSRANRWLDTLDPHKLSEEL
jgi:hypothetical protein